MIQVAQALAFLKPCRVLVIGDLILDKYVFGDVKRISPEAPVPVVNIKRETQLAGGAGNVAMSLHALGNKVRVVGRVGHDKNANCLIDLLSVLDDTIIFAQTAYQTPTKTRIIASHQQMMRIDYEQITPLDVPLEKEIISRLGDLLKDIDVVAVSDYGKGFLSSNLLAALIQLCNNHNIPVIVDPKSDNFSKYSGATLIKPNLSEAYMAAKAKPEEDLETVATKIFDSCPKTSWLCITRAQEGMSLFSANQPHHYYAPANAKEVLDVTGAGDTVLSMICMAWASGVDPDLMLKLANCAAGIAVEHVGCAQVGLSQIAQRIMGNIKQDKILTASHLEVFEKLHESRKCILITVQDASSCSHEVLDHLFDLRKKYSDHFIVIQLAPNFHDEVFKRVLLQLSEIDFISEDTDLILRLKQVCKCKIIKQWYGSKIV